MCDNLAFSPLYAPFMDKYNHEEEEEEKFCNNCGDELAEDVIICPCILKARSRRATNNLVEEVAKEINLFEIMAKILKPENQLI